VTRLARRAAQRLTMRGVLRAACAYAAVAAAIAVVVSVIASLTGPPVMPWGWIAIGLGGAVVAAAGARWATSQVSPMRGAIVLDERLHLDDSLSTALAFTASGREPLVASQQEVATAHATSRDVQRAVPGAIPIGLPPRWWWPVSLATVAAAIAVLPPMVGEGSAAPPIPRGAMVEAQLDTDEAIAAMQEALDGAPDLQAAMEDPFDLEHHAELNDPAELRQETLRDLTELNRQFEEFQSGEQQRQLRRVQDRLAAMTQSQDASAEVRRAMRAGDMEAMAEAMQRLRSGDRASADASAAALEALAQDVADAAMRDEAMEQVLADAGLQDADVLEDATHLTESQREELRKQLMDAVAASEMLDGLSKDCKEAASQCKNPGKTPAPNSDAASKKLAKSQRACKQAGQCQKACKSGLGKAGRSLTASKLPGRMPGGAGPRRAEEDPSANTAAARTRADMDASTPVVASAPISGPLTRGAASTPADAPIQSARRRIERGLDVQRIPRRYREAVAAWFASTREVAAAAKSDAGADAGDEPSDAGSDEDSGDPESPGGSESP